MLVLAVLGAARQEACCWPSCCSDWNANVFLIKALARGADIHLNWTVLAVAIGCCRGFQPGGFSLSGAAAVGH
jgi:hypothetical protein